MTREMRIELVDPDADPGTVQELAAGLREELLELDVDSVVPTSDAPAPDGSKGLEALAPGVLLLQLRSSLPLINAAMSAVRAWLARQASARRSVKVTVDGRTLELSAATADQQEQLVAEFVRSLHSTG